MNSQNYSHKLVLRVNELYHDLEGHEEYGHSHDEIFVLEPARWKRVLETSLGDFLKKDSKTILDVGSGTGFVPLTIGRYFGKNDLFVCADISEKMLGQCRANIEKENLACRFDYKKYDGVHLPASDNSADLVTANSVLHHIPDTKFFLKEVGRVLKSGGYLIIGHEPNESFYKNKAIWTIYRILYLLYHPRAIFDTLARRGLWKRKTNNDHNNDNAWIYSPFCKGGVRRTGDFLKKGRKIPPPQCGAPPFKKGRIIKENYDYDKTAEKINGILLSEKLIDKPFSRSQINAIVDYYSIAGFNLEEIKNNLPGFKLAHFETYNHLYWIFMQHYRNSIIGALDKILGWLYPKDGKTMMVVFQKSHSV